MTETNNDSLDSIRNEIDNIAASFEPHALYSLVATADVVNMYVDRALRKYDYDRTKFTVMYTLIAHGGGMTRTEISKRVYRSKQQITAVIDSLERDGLVRNQPIVGDRRIKMVTITRKALDVCRGSLSHRGQISDEAMSCLKAEEVTRLTVILRKIRKHLIKKVNELRLS